MLARPRGIRIVPTPTRRPVGIWYRWVVAIFVLLVLASSEAVLAAGSSSRSNGSSTSQNSNAPGTSFPLPGIHADPFVEASPLVVGVVCSDGVLLLAVHSIFATDNPESSLLIEEVSTSESEDSEDDDDDDEIEENESDDESDDTSSATIASLDLPKIYRGPFRIHTLGRSAAMVCAGWRTDAEVLSRHLRSLDADETRVFGTLATGSMLADRACLFLARHAVSEGQRPLACASLLASPDCGLWVVDATGAYRVRAHALGQGSYKAHDILRARDWTQLDSAAAQRLLIDRLRKKKDLYPKGSRFELALVPGSSETGDGITTPQPKTPLKRLFVNR